ncbi:hypothetical protein ACFL6U_11725 [Planctomycetota bacterium]
MLRENTEGNISMNFFKSLLLGCCLLVMGGGCNIKQAADCAAEINMHSGQFHQRDFDSSTSVYVGTSDKEIYLAANILLETGELHIAIMMPGGRLYKAFIATPGEHIQLNERLPSIPGEWRVAGKCNYAKGLVTVGFKIPADS